jgi:hypothetical protein
LRSSLGGRGSGRDGGGGSGTTMSRCGSGGLAGGIDEFVLIAFALFACGTCASPIAVLPLAVLSLPFTLTFPLSLAITLPLPLAFSLPFHALTFPLTLASFAGILGARTRQRLSFLLFTKIQL